MMSGTVKFLALLIACQAALGDVVGPLVDDSSKSSYYRLPENVKPTSYVLSLQPDLEKFVFEGTATITITALKATNTLTLNAKQLKVEKSDVTVTGSDKKPIPVNEVTLQDEREFLIIELAQQLVKDQAYTLTIKYSGTLNDQKRGFYRSKYFDKDNVKKYIATTHFEPTGARLAFPCWDEPAYKANFTISLTHPATHQAISNMPEEKREDVKGTKLVKTTFKVTKDMSTYLVAFVVSDYGVLKDDDTFRVWTKDHAKQHGRYALDTGKKLLAKLDEYTGIKYADSIPKMDQVTVKDFSPSAMENWGLITYRETALLYEEGVTTTRSKISITTIIAHEFAHQWFGNLVSPKWWKFIWLNEGFANYMQHFITHQIIPEWRLSETFVVDNMQGNAFVADAVEDARPMNMDASSPGEISKLFDSIGYQKAGSVIRMMSHILSEEVFQAGLKKYLTAKKYSTADSDDLIKSLSEVANKKWEDVELSEIMKQWFEKSGYPVLNVKQNEKGDYELTQERFLLYGGSDTTKWWIPLTYTEQSNPDFKNTTPVAWLKPNDANLVIENKNKDDWILFNKQQTGYYRVNYDEDNWSKLQKYLNTDEYLKIEPINRAQLIDDALNLAHSQRLNYTVALSLVTYLNQEQDYVPWAAAFRNLNFLQNMLRKSSHYDLFKLYVKYLTKTVVKEVGFESQKNDTDLQKILRPTLLKWACRVDVEECTSYVEDRFNAWLENPVNNSLNVDLRNNILCFGLKSADKETWNKTLDALLKSTVDEDERNSLLTVLACSESSDILKEYLLSSLEKDSPISFDSALKAVVSEFEDGADVALDVFVSQQEKIRELENAEDVIKSCTASIAAAVTREEQYVQLSLFIAKQGVKAEYVQDAAKKAARNLDWLKSNEGVIGNWLIENEHVYNSATSTAFATLLLVASIFITRFY